MSEDKRPPRSDKRVRRAPSKKRAAAEGTILPDDWTDDDDSDCDCLCHTDEGICMFPCCNRAGMRLPDRGCFD